MVELTERTQLMRQAQAFDILIMSLNERISEQEACQRADMNYRTYREWISTDPNALDALRDFIHIAQLRTLAEVEVAWPHVIHELVTDAVDPTLKTRDRLALAEWLHEYKTGLEHQYHAQPGIEDEAHAFLKEGPQLTPVKSRMASLEIEPTDSGGISVHVSEYHEVIDITPEKD